MLKQSSPCLLPGTLWYRGLETEHLSPRITRTLYDYSKRILRGLQGILRQSQKEKITRSCYTVRYEYTLHFRLI